MLAAFTVEEVTMAMVLVVREYANVSLDDLLSLPLDWEIEFGIDVLLGTALISKALYQMAPMEL